MHQERRSMRRTHSTVVFHVQHNGPFVSRYVARDCRLGRLELALPPSQSPADRELYPERRPRSTWLTTPIAALPMPPQPAHRARPPPVPSTSLCSATGPDPLARMKQQRQLSFRIPSPYPVTILHAAVRSATTCSNSEVTRPPCRLYVHGFRQQMRDLARTCRSGDESSCQRMGWPPSNSRCRALAVQRPYEIHGGC